MAKKGGKRLKVSDLGKSDKAAKVKGGISIPHYIIYKGGKGSTKGGTKATYG